MLKISFKICAKKNAFLYILKTLETKCSLAAKLFINSWYINIIEHCSKWSIIKSTHIRQGKFSNCFVFLNTINSPDQCANWLDLGPWTNEGIL